MPHQAKRRFGRTPLLRASAERAIRSLRHRERSPTHMTPDQLIELKRNSVLRGRLAKLFALECFRNSKLEDLHTGKSPSSKTDDYSDVKVVTPYGEIPWNNLSCLRARNKERTVARLSANLAERHTLAQYRISFEGLLLLDDIWTSFFGTEKNS
jgi:hypothetical protein